MPVQSVCDTNTYLRLARNLSEFTVAIMKLRKLLPIFRTACVLLALTWAPASGQWTQAGVDIDGEATGDRSGSGVALSGDGLSLAIGAPENSGSGRAAGHVRVYRWNGDSWVQRGSDIDGEFDQDGSGFELALSSDGRRLAIGAANNGSNNNRQLGVGHVRVFEWDDNAWIQIGDDVDGERRGDFFGSAVDLSGDGNRIAAAPEDGRYIKIFDWVDGGWIESARISTEGGSEVSLSADGRHIVIGFPGDDTASENAGLVRVFSIENGEWIQRGGDILGRVDEVFPGFFTEEKFGREVDISTNGNRIAVQASEFGPTFFGSGLVRVFAWDGTTWNQLGGDIAGTQSQEQFGWSVSLSSEGDRIVIGAPNSDGTGIRTGIVQTYDWSGNSWLQFGNTLQSEELVGSFGFDVAISGDGQLIAAGDPSNGLAGHVRAWSTLTAVPNTPVDVLASDGRYSDRIRVTWADNSGETGYRVFRCSDDATENCAQIASLPNDKNLYDDFGAPQFGQVVFYRVQACNFLGCSDFSTLDGGFRITVSQILIFRDGIEN